MHAMGLLCLGDAVSAEHCRACRPAIECSPEFKAGARTPDHPQSLYEGWAAALCLWADLLGKPEAGGFPLFEVELEE
jgi:hypothetical protein